MSELRRRFTLVLLCLALPVSAAWAQVEPQPKLPTVQLRAGMHNIEAEVARTPEQQQLGLMARKAMAAHEGMLFVFPDKQPLCFWMRNTLLPLTIAYLDDDGTIVTLADMQPLSEASHCASKPVRFALEMLQGWFKKRSIGTGFKLSGPMFSR